MTERIRFHLDENVDPDVARALRRHGIDVTTSVEVGMLTTEDVAQLAYALEEGRVIVTHDADFSEWMLGALNMQVLRIATSQPVRWEKSSER